MNWKNFYERVRYYSTLIWLNTFGLIPEIVFILRYNRKVIDEGIKQENRTELRKDIIKLLFFLGALLLCIYFFLLGLHVFLIIAIALLLAAFLGLIGEAFIDLIAQIVS